MTVYKSFPNAALHTAKIYPQPPHLIHLHFFITGLLNETLIYVHETELEIVEAEHLMSGTIGGTGPRQR